jgi:hypothetical protein
MAQSDDDRKVLLLSPFFSFEFTSVQVYKKEYEEQGMAQSDDDRKLLLLSPFLSFKF